MLFVSIVIFALLFVTSGWTICYYTLRFRSMHKKDKKRVKKFEYLFIIVWIYYNIKRNVFNAVKKALSKIPTRPIKLGDKEIDIECPVCIESYRAGGIRYLHLQLSQNRFLDICRQLPCKYSYKLFHICKNSKKFKAFIS